MVLCSFCNKRESRSRRFSTAYVCEECYNDDNNYDFNYELNNDELIFVDASNKKYKISKDTELEILNITQSTNNEKNIGLPIDDEHFKNALLASLYSQVEFLKSQLEEKDLLIRTLIIRDQDIEYGSENSVNIFNTQAGGSVESPITINIDEEATAEVPIIRNTDEDWDKIWGKSDDAFFQELYEQYEMDMIENNNKKQEIENQLSQVRKQKHKQYKGLLEKREKARKPGTNYYKNIQEITDPNEQWPENTILVLGDSMINQMDEEKLSRSSKKSIKVRAYGGHGVNDIYGKLDTLLKKNPSKVIIHLGTNDAPHATSQKIFDDLLKLKRHIESKIDGVEVIFSCPITRFDNGKAKVTIMQLIAKLQLLKVKILSNENISDELLGKHGLHLSTWGVKRFATNLIHLLRKL